MALEVKRRAHGGEWMRLGLRFGAAALLVLAAFFSVRGAWRMNERFQEAAAASAAAEDQLRSLQKQQTALEARVSALSTGRGVEAAVRERFGVVRPGEGVIQIVENPSAAASSTPDSPSLWERLWHAFFVW